MIDGCFFFLFFLGGGGGEWGVGLVTFLIHFVQGDMHDMHFYSMMFDMNHY